MPAVKKKRCSEKMDENHFSSVKDRSPYETKKIHDIVLMSCVWQFSGKITHSLNYILNFDSTNFNQ